MTRRGVSQDTVAKALRTLEESAMQNIHDFGSQQIVNTIHIMVKERHYEHKENLLLTLDRRTEAISGEFNSQVVVNTMWTYATMGTKPGEKMMGQLERRTETISGEFNSQDVVNKLWSYETMGRKPGERMMG
jgi:hypothetical protein